MTDVCLRATADPEDVDLHDLTTCPLPPVPSPTSVDVCLRTLADPDDVDLHDLLTCPVTSTGGGNDGSFSIRNGLRPRRPVRAEGVFTASVVATAEMTFTARFPGRGAEEELLGIW